MKSKNVFLTGSEGFIGSHMVEALVKKNFNVRALVMYNSFNSMGWLDICDPNVKGHFEVFSGDIRDPHTVRHSVRNCQQIIHLAQELTYLTPSTFEKDQLKLFLAKAIDQFLEVTPHLCRL